MSETKKPVEDLFAIKREVDSVDDFEHLGHDSSPLEDLTSFKPDKEVTAPGTVDEIDITPKTAVSHSHTGSSDTNSASMNRNLLEDDFLGRGEGLDKLDSFLQEPPLAPAPVFDIGSNKQSSFNLIEAERVSEPIEKHADQFLDFEDFKPAKTVDSFKADAFGDILDSEPVPVSKVVTPPAPEVPAPLPQEPAKKPIESLPLDVPASDKKSLLEKTTKPASEKTERIESVATSSKIALPDAAAIFCKMGLDAWFNPEKLDPKVESLIYWRDPKKSGPVFGGVLLVLLALTYFSLISVVAYVSLIGLGVTIAFRIYKNIVQAVQKTGDGHPFKEYLEMDVSLPQDKVKEITEVAIAHVNAAVRELRRLFLVEDLVDSIKFAVLLWIFTYVGAWFNGMTLVILSWVSLFTFPKIYETNKTQIDANLEIVRTKLAEVTSKIKAAIPMGKKTEEKKEQ
ncbi:unnamed protein product [Phyllotreta striolata]|uniref:Reticulon-like protein n=1 Tax=Phyllotreta striolata TaxID=444603 RepID=A0A9N9TP89_PHYSR|nr:unnamed protein product [Phyllotreta striolata]